MLYGLNISYDRACILRTLSKSGITGRNYSLNSGRIKYLEAHGMIKCIDRDPHHKPMPIGAFVLTERGKTWVSENANRKGPKAFKNNYA